MPATLTTPPELHIPQITIGVRLKLARESADLSQYELGDAIGIAPRSVQNYERGNTTPKRPVLLSWALATGVPLSWLTEGETEMTCPHCDGEVHPGMTCFLGCAQVSDSALSQQPDAPKSHLRLVPEPC